MAQRDNVEIQGKDTQLVIFRLAEEEFGAEINSVLEVSPMLEITRIPDAPGFVEGVVNLRGQVIAVVDLAKQVGLAEQQEVFNTARIIVVEAGRETVGLIVDEVREVLVINTDHIEATPEYIKSRIQENYMTGVAMLDDRLVIILDLGQVLLPQQVTEVEGLAQS